MQCAVYYIYIYIYGMNSETSVVITLKVLVLEGCKEASVNVVNLFADFP